VLAWPSFAAAQGGPPQARPAPIRGTIVKLDGNMLAVKTREGPTDMVMLAPNFAVRTLVREKLSDIHAGDFVGVTSVMGKDGKPHAVEVHVFPATLNIPDSQFPYDLRPNSTMTNAHVTGIAKAGGGSVLSVNYKTGSTDVVIDKKTVIVGPAPTQATAADLKPHRAVYIIASKKDDGSFAATNVTVEKNGVKPPM